MGRHDSALEPTIVPLLRSDPDGLPQLLGYVLKESDEGISHDLLYLIQAFTYSRLCLHA